MRRPHYSIDQLASVTARRAQGEAAMMQADLRKLRGSVLNSGRTYVPPRIKPKRARTKKTAETSFVTEIASVLNALSGASESFSAGNSGIGYTSQAQAAGSALDSASGSSRVR